MKLIESPNIEKFNTSWLSLTYLCQNKCVWCYAGSQDASISRGKVFDYSRLDSTLDLIRDLKVQSLLLIGGEPTVYPRIEEVVQKATQRGIGTHLVTNGRRLKDRDFVKRLKNNGIRQIAFSVEGSNAVTHDYTTQSLGSYFDTMKGLENSLDEGIISGVTTVISTINQFELNEMIDKSKKLGMKKHNFNLPGICMGGDYEFMIPIPEAIKIYERAYHYAKSKGLVAHLLTPTAKCLFDPKTLEELKKDECLANSPCQLTSGNNFVIDWNGDVVPCTHLTGYPMFNIFNDSKTMNRDEFIMNMNSPDAKQFRSKVNRYAIEECSSCDERCSGGCPLYWMKYNPNDIIPGKPFVLDDPYEDADGNMYHTFPRIDGSYITHDGYKLK